MENIIGLFGSKKNVPSLTISIDVAGKKVIFYSINGRDKTSIESETKTFKQNAFEEDFFAWFSAAVKEYGDRRPEYVARSAKVTVLVPDYLVATDSISIPGVKNGGSLYKVSIERKYKNLNELEVHKSIAVQNKQVTVYSLAIIRVKLLQAIYAACNGSSVFADVITFCGNATVNAAMSFNGRLKNGTFALLDIKRQSSRICFVSKGTTVGVYPLPFGYDILKTDKLVSENMLFDHSYAELAVLNAKEKAKAKSLTMGSDAALEIAEQELDEDDAFANSEDDARNNLQIKTLPKKTPRILPKFMLRPVPTDEEGYVFENFRLFVKWTLDAVHANAKLAAPLKFENVLVNIPHEFAFVIDKTNSEEEENGLRFVSLGLEEENPLITLNLELYGAAFADQFNKRNNF